LFKKGLCQEFRFISHLNLTTLLVPLRSGRIENFARTINSFLLNRLIQFNLLITVPICTQFDSGDEIENTAEIVNARRSDSSWYWWKKMRSLCEENSKLGLVIELAEDVSLNDFEIERWFSEPVKAFIIPTKVFLTNKSGFPVLSKSHQKIVSKFFRVI
jgi:protein arginine N-methyltransferase 5